MSIHGEERELYPFEKALIDGVAKAQEGKREEPGEAFAYGDVAIETPSRIRINILKKPGEHRGGRLLLGDSLAPGDIIRCANFAYGIVFQGETEILAGLTKEIYEWYCSHQNSPFNVPFSKAFDVERGHALFLVLSGCVRCRNETVTEWNYRQFLYESVKCIRLENDNIGLNAILRDAERIRIYSVTEGAVDPFGKMTEKSIEIVGRITLPFVLDSKVEMARYTTFRADELF